MAGRIDITNQRFGRLVALHKGQTVKNVTHWVCECDCGTIAEVSTRALIKGHTKSCGCYRRESFRKIRGRGTGKFVDLTGNRYGRLVVLRHIGSDEQQKSLFLCRCDCGIEKIVRGHNLKYGFTKSCGCLRKEKFEALRNNGGKNNG